MTNTVRYPLVLTVVCAIAAMALAVTYAVTKPKIDQREKQALSAALEFVSPSGADDFREVVGEKDGGPVYLAKNSKDIDGPTLGYAAVGQQHGYSSRITVMVGVYPDYRIAAIRVLSCQETPGLGQRVEEVESTDTFWTVLFGSGEKQNEQVGPEPEPWFQEQFRNKQPDQLAVVTRVEAGKTPNIASISGATISSNAATDAVKNAIAKIKNYRETKE
jgi:electron transport complex protein RnfG